MKQTLFESLVGTFMDGTRIGDVPVDKRIIHSVMDNLNRLFNTQLGTIPHLENYGLPDLTNIFHQSKAQAGELKEAILKAIEIYEPRLANVDILPLDEQTHPDNRLVVILSGEIKPIGKVMFQTMFFSTGQSTIAPWKRDQE